MSCAVRPISFMRVDEPRCLEEAELRLARAAAMVLVEPHRGCIAVPDLGRVSYLYILSSNSQFDKDINAIEIPYL